MGVGILVTSDGSITLPGLLLIVGIPLFFIGHYKVLNELIGSYHLFGKPIQLLLGMLCVTVGLALSIAGVLVKDREGNEKDLKYELLPAEDILVELRSMATADMVVTLSKDGNGSAERTVGADIIDKSVRCLDALALKCGKEQARRKQRREAAQGEERSEFGEVWASIGLHKAHELEMMCQEAAYIVLRLHSSNDAAVSASLSLLALVAGDAEVRRKHLEEADQFGLDVPVLTMRGALTRAKECDEAPEEEERVSAELQRKGCLLLGALSNDDKDLATKVVDEDGLVAVLDAVEWYRYHEEVANWALWAVFVLCYDHKGNKGELIRLGGIQRICRVMKDIPTSVEVARHGIAVLFDMMREVPESLHDVAQIRLIALNAGMHDVVKRAMDEFPNSTEIMMMGQQMLVATGYQGEIPMFRR